MLHSFDRTLRALMSTVAVGALLVVAACDEGSGGPRLPPPEGRAYYAVDFDWSADSPAAYRSRLGATPAVYLDNVRIPLGENEFAYLDDHVRAIVGEGGGLLLTLEPHDGLEAVTPAAARALADRLALYNARGVPVWVSFGPDMNGSWYPWGQQPEEYIAAFRTVAAEVHDKTSETALVWAPVYGAGYPFIDGTYAVQPGTSVYDHLDTDGDGDLTQWDDPYGPYYPGDQYVDWVSMGLHHWGGATPWTRNELPEPDKLVQRLTGAYNGEAGDERMLPDFYVRYARHREKPLILRTAALTVSTWSGDAPDAVKRAWWQQAFAADLHDRFPYLGMIAWTEWSRREDVVDAVVDWRVTHEPTLATEFRAAFPRWVELGRR